MAQKYICYKDRYCVDILRGKKSLGVCMNFLINNLYENLPKSLYAKKSS